MKKAQEIIEFYKNEWGVDRELFPASADELLILLDGELTVDSFVLNRDNLDGTFYSEVIVEGKIFCYSGVDRINGPVS